jgi:cell division protein FtsQ
MAALGLYGGSVRRRVFLSLLLVLFGGLLLTSRYYPTIARIEVTGGMHYSREELLALANFDVGDPFLWVTSWRLQRLIHDPWISHVRVIRHWPDTISLTVWEREPVLYDGETVYALDGTVLPNVKETAHLTRLEGWGAPRIAEALELRRLLAQFEPEVISYTPGGFEVRLTTTQLFTPNVELLKAHWAGFLSQRGRFVAVYPWGVSVQP